MQSFEITISCSYLGPQPGGGQLSNSPKILKIVFSYQVQPFYPPPKQIVQQVTIMLPPKKCQLVFK